MHHILSCYGIIGAMDTEIQMIREAAGMNGDAVLEEPTPPAPPAPAVPVPVERASTWCWQSAASAR